MSDSDKDLVDLKLVCFHETDKAYLVGLTEDREQAVWIPKSKCERYDRCGKVKGIPIYEFSIEEWLATEKELV